MHKTLVGLASTIFAKKILFPTVMATGLIIGLSLVTDGAEAQPAKPAAKTAKKKTSTLPSRKGGVKKTSPQDAQTPGEGTEAAADDIETLPRKSSVNVDLKSAIRLNYGRRDWNLDPTKIDEAVIFLRESDTGRIVQIQAEETAPDSAAFSGIYSINWEKFEDRRIEFYAPPQKLLADVNGRVKVSQMIESKELRRLPFVMRKDSTTGVQNIELFDTAEQARAAYRAFQSEKQLLDAMKLRAVQKGQILETGKTVAEKDQAVDTALLAEKAEFERLSRDLAERVRLGQIENQRLSQLIQKFSSLTPDQRAKQKRDAQAAADQAMLHYRGNRFQEARDSFDKAVELDPTNRSYYYQYGVTLYKTQEFNRSLVYLDLADAKDINPAEKNFYRGLNFYQLKDSKSSLEAFDKVVAADDVEISPSANFYRGLLHFDKKDWAAARTEFQATLDKSKDPALDERAEAYIENILRQQQVEAERSRRWTLTGNVGLIYDDNVLVASDSDRDRGTASDLVAYRSLFSGSARYRAMYEEAQEFAVQLDLMTMYSVDKNFQRSQSITNYDPTVATLTLPWTHKGMFLGKGYKFDFAPGYETTYMGIENNEWKSILNSYIAGFQNLFVMDERWYMNVNLEIRQDNSTLNSSTGENDLTALKSKLTWSNINFLEDKKQLILSDLSYTSNNAKGKNAVFNRVDAGVGYVAPWKWNTTFISKLSYFLLSYPENTSGRVDNSYTLTLGLSRPWTEKLSVGLIGVYNVNSSNVEANQYKKTNIMVTLTANDAF